MGRARHISRPLFPGTEHPLHRARRYHPWPEYRRSRRSGGSPGRCFHRAGYRPAARLVASRSAAAMIVGEITIIGAVVAVAYVSVVGSVLWWMLHIPQAGGLEQQVQ